MRVLVQALLLIGALCGVLLIIPWPKPTQPEAPKPVPPPAVDWVQKLKTAAEAQHLKWRIVLTPDDGYYCAETWKSHILDGVDFHLHFNPACSKDKQRAAEEAYKYLTGQTEIVVEGNDDKP